MSTPISINGSQFFVPEAGESPQWGSELNETIVALATAVNSLSGSADIPLTIFSLANNQASPTSITGVTFNTGTVRSFILQYSLYRSTNSNEEAETGILFGCYKSVSATWNLSQQYSGSSGVTLSITSGGQLQYTSSSLSGSSYSGKISIKATSFLQ